ncbi:hypothetical protein CHS0354_013930 [Potamilus streckersoni]|uniref:RRM domain-containing protein n=1 Tax=Potamilus streckersoni TaxID=2493646 RepID=A0AAE0RWU3_9BIVA|nr:hypothetical protein CHS0354_013930 [Potamilus streckersoni]
MVSEICFNGHLRNGEHSDYQEELEINKVDKQTGKLILREEQSDSDCTLNEKSELEKLIDYGIDKSVAVELLRFFKDKNISYDDLDETAREAIKEFSLNDAKLMIDLVLKSDVEYVVNNSSYICFQMKIFITNKSSYTDPSMSLPGPDKEKLREILKETGYPLEIIPGHRRYGGPPPDYKRGPPRHGHEVNVGCIPKDWFEDKLVPLFQTFGTIYEIRLPIDIQTGYNKRYCFVSYCKKDDANSACQRLTYIQYQPDKRLRTNIRNTERCLYVRKIPMYMSSNELKKEFEKITPGIKDVFVCCTPEMQEIDLKNNGYCYVDYEDHKQAAAAKEDLGRVGSRLFGPNIVADWANPEDEPDDEFMSEVKVVYVKNISKFTKLDTLKIWFERFGKIEKVDLGEGYGLVHFENREDALTAIEKMNGRMYGRYRLECSLSMFRDLNSVILVKGVSF